MPMFLGGWRRVTGIYLALFFLAVVGAPHDHVNGLEDLLLDQPSGSGEIAESDAPPIDPGGSTWYAERLVADDPCLACFNSDYVATPPPILAYAPHLERFDAGPCFVTGRAPWVLFRETPSRAPPRPS